LVGIAKKYRSRFARFAKHGKPGGWLNLAFQLAVAGSLGYLLYRQLWQGRDIAVTLSSFQGGLRAGHWPALVFAVMLMPLNWAVEALKWRHFLALPCRLSLRRALAAVLAGITLSLITPNRLGDYGGRALLTPSPHRWRAVAATAWSGYCQLAVVVLGGGFGVFYYGALFWPGSP